jgi:hypothetical protein
MTSSEHVSGTDRIAELARSLDYDIIVNVQGDEPLIRPEMIDDVIAVLDDGKASIGTLAIKIKDLKEIFDPNVVKVVFDHNGYALYFSHGFSIVYKKQTKVIPPKNVDLIMVAPKGSGRSVRANFLDGNGIDSSFAVFQDSPAGQRRGPQPSFHRARERHCCAVAGGTGNRCRSGPGRRVFVGADINGAVGDRRRP